MEFLEMDVADAKTELAASSCFLSLGRIFVSSLVFDLFTRVCAIGLYSMLFSCILPTADCLVKILIRRQTNLSYLRSPVKSATGVSAFYILCNFQIFVKALEVLKITRTKRGIVWSLSIVSWICAICPRVSITLLNYRLAATLVVGCRVHCWSPC